MPTRPTQQDVSLALLAFDAYNRGANAQLMYTDEQRLATTIGDADWQRNSDNIAAATTTRSKVRNGSRRDPGSGLGPSDQARPPADRLVEG